MAIKVVNSSPGTIKVTVNEIPKINVSVTSSSAINIEPGITTGERSKLAGIESGATADQTDAEIKTAYENNANTNAFTDAEQTKLSGIDASADVTDATTVLAAGAVMTTGDQTIAGNKTFSGNTVLGTTVTGAIATTGSVSILSSQNLTVTGALSVSGTSNLQGAVSFDSDLQAPALKFTGSGTNIIGPLGSGGTQDDLEIQSNGNVTVKLDSDNDESGQKLKVVNNSGTEKFSVQEDGTVTVYGKIVSDSGGDIDIEPNGTGDVLLGNFKFDADQSVGSGQDNFVLTYDNSTGKISLEAATGGTSTLLGLSDTPSSFTASKFVKVNSAGDAIEFVDDSNLNALVTMLKSGSTTTLTSIGDGTSTDKGVLNLGASSASLKFNTTGITIDEASPGDIEFIVATDSSGSTAFTAAHIDGGTSANSADFLIKNGTAFKIEGASGSARLSHTGGNVALTLPSSTGTLATTSQVPSNVTDLSDVSSAGSGSIITSSERTKLTNIETAADVTDATNVAAAGALMASSAQLTGNLDVQANEINTTTSNGNVKVAANGTGVLELRGNNGSGSDDNPGAIKLNCAENSHGITLKAPAHSAFSGSYTLTLPPGVESSDANKVLQTDASGNLDWVALPSDTNTQNTTTLSFVDSSDDIILRNTTGGAGSGTQDIKFVAGSNVTLTHTDANNITIAASGSGGSSTFLGLTDTPSSFTASKFLKVNSSGNAVEFADGGGSGIASLSEDTNPTLGGDLIVGSNDIKSVGDVEIVVDSDNNTTDSSFTVKNGAGTVIFSVNESGVSSGLLTTVTPTISGSSSTYAQGASVTGISISNHVTGRSYEGKIFNSSGTEQTSNPVTIDSNGNVSFTAPSTVATGYELRISATDTGKLKSTEGTATFEVTVTRTFTYWRVQGVDSSGTASANRAAFVELTFHTGANATGTETPTSDATSATSISGVTISSGHQYSSSYANWRAFDGTAHGTASTGSMWWTLGNSNADLVWIQLQFSSAQTFESLKLTVYNSFNDATHIIVKGSNTGSYSGEEVSFGLTAIDESGSAGITTVNF